MNDLINQLKNMRSVNYQGRKKKKKAQDVAEPTLQELYERGLTEEKA